MAVGTVRSVCVFCGSASGIQPAYASAAADLGHQLATRRIRLVFGGGSVGIMGAVADAALAAGGQVIGVIPAALADQEIAHHGVTDLQVVRSMHERKQRMADQSDAFIVLPGGLGTLEEMFEVVTWTQLGFHRKPCGLINVAGYFDHLLRFIEHAADQGFISAGHRSLLQVGATPRQLLDQML